MITNVEEWSSPNLPQPSESPEMLARLKQQFTVAAGKEQPLHLVHVKKRS